MSEYLVSRAEGAPPVDEPPDVVGVPLFFQMWATRQDPYSALEEGDTLWWVDQASREVRWELRVVNIRRARYEARATALDRLRRWFGVLPSDLNDYGVDRTDGWLIAWENELIAPVGVVLPVGEALGRNGFRRVDPMEARRWGLPEPGRDAAVAAQRQATHDDPYVAGETRYIPLHVRRAVFHRDGHVCRQCDRDDAPMHLDHIYPWSKGGSNEPENLQVLCAPCNLAKGADPQGAMLRLIPALSVVVEAARLTERAVPRDIDQLESLLTACVSRGFIDEAFNVAWGLWFHPDGDLATFTAVEAGLTDVSDAYADELDLFTTLAAGTGSVSQVRRFAESGRPSVAARAAAALLEGGSLDESDAVRYAEAAFVFDDAVIRSIGALALARRCEDDARWRELMLCAIEHGDGDTASLAAFELGAQLVDDAEAFTWLERGLRSPSASIAAEAARQLATRFNSDAQAAAAYERYARELDAQVRR